jgi:ribonuclease P protein component
MSDRLTRAERIRRHSEFEEARQHGVRSRGRFLTLLIRPNGLRFARLGIITSRRFGGAVQRNRARRLVREVFRRRRPREGFDIVVIPRRELLDSAFASLEADYRSALSRHLR